MVCYVRMEEGQSIFSSYKVNKAFIQSQFHDHQMTDGCEKRRIVVEILVELVKNNQEKEKDKMVFLFIFILISLLGHLTTCFKRSKGGCQSCLGSLGE